MEGKGLMVGLVGADLFVSVKESDERFGWHGMEFWLYNIGVWHVRYVHGV
jgi:hypothetical protein